VRSDLETGARVASTRKSPARGSGASRASKAAPKAARGGAAAAGPGRLRRLAGSVGAILAEQRRDLWGIVLLLIAVISGLGIYLDAAGPVGRWVDVVARGGLGLVGYLLPLLLMAFGALLVMDRPGPEVGRLGLGFALAILAVLAGAHLAVDVPAPGEGVEALARGGGVVGWLIAAPLDARALTRRRLGRRRRARGARRRRDRTARAPVRPWPLWPGPLRGSRPRRCAALRVPEAERDPTSPRRSSTRSTAPLDASRWTEPQRLAAVEQRAVVDVWLDDDPEDATTELPAVVDVQDAPTEPIDRPVDVGTGRRREDRHRR
jgi:hypothetical protein